MDKALIQEIEAELGRISELPTSELIEEALASSSRMQMDYHGELRERRQVMTAQFHSRIWDRGEVITIEEVRELDDIRDAETRLQYRLLERGADPSYFRY